MKLFKWFLILGIISLISAIAIVISMRNSIVRYGVNHYFTSKGLMIDVGPVTIDSFDHISVAYLRLQKKTENKRFVLELRDMQVWGRPLDFLLKGSVDRITFKNPYVNWGKLTPALHNPFRGTFMQKSQLFKKPEGINFNNTFGVLSLKALAKQQISFDLFPEGQNLEYGTISGRFFEEGQNIRGYFDLQSADVQYDDTIFTVDLNRTGTFTGGFHLNWSPSKVNLGLNPFTIKTSKILSMGEFSFDQNDDDVDCLKGESQIEFNKRSTKVAFETTKDKLHIHLDSLLDKKEKGAMKADILFDKEGDHSNMTINLYNQNHLLLKGVVSKEDIVGDLLLTRTSGRKLQAKFTMTKIEDAIGLEFKNLFWEKQSLPGMKLQFEIRDGQCFVNKLEWGERFLELKGEIGLGLDKPIELSVDMNRFDLAILTPFLKEDILETVSAVVSGKASLYGSVIDPQFKIDIKFNEGHFKKLKFRSGEFHSKGNKKRLMIDSSRFVREKDMIFYEGELVYEAGGIENKISYTTDGKSLEWAGWAMEKGEKEFSLERKITDQLLVKFRNQSIFQDKAGLSYNESQLDLEFDMETSSHDLLFMTIKEDEEIMGVKRKYEF